MILHLVYPTGEKKKTSPWAEGNFLKNYFSKYYKVKCYNWLSFESIQPNSGDIIIGHAHPNPMTVFRRSIKNQGWSKTILFQPYNEDIYQLGYLKDVLPFCDHYLALCGSYWFNRVENSIFSEWKKKMIHVDLGIDYKLFPHIKENFNNIKSRKYLYIGNDYAFNNWAKNFQYLKNITKNYGKKYFATAGNRKIQGVKHYGWINILSKDILSEIKKYDYLIVTSKHDANPAVILEAMSWGLIPIITKQSGYENEKNFIYIPLNDLDKTLKILNFTQNIPNDKLKEMSLYNLHRIKNYYTPQRFCQTFHEVIQKKIDKNNDNLYKKLNNYEIEKKIKISPNYYLKPLNIISIIKANLVILIKKIFNL